MYLPQRIENIKSHLDGVSRSKTKLAFALLNTKRSENWGSTTYISWKGFCNMNVALSTASVYVYVKTAEMAENNKFTPTASDYIVQTIGWERFRLGLTKIGESEVITAAKFIERYKHLNLNERITYEESESNLENFTFNVPSDTADKLNSLLTTYGMRTTNRSRTNMSSALIKLVESLKEEV